MQLDPANEMERGQQMLSMLPFFIFNPLQKLLRKAKVLLH